MQIEFQAISDDHEENYGVFRLPVGDCINFLRGQFQDYAFRLDGELLQWVELRNGRKSNSAQDRIPDAFDDCARFMVVALWDNGSPFNVVCTKCGLSIRIDDLSRREWEDTSTCAGMKLGVSGFRIVCPAGHTLLTVATRVY